MEVSEKQVLLNKILALQDRVVKLELENSELSHCHDDSLAYFIAQYVPLMVLVKDAKSGRVLFWNRCCEETIGLKQGEVLGKTVFDVFPKNEAEVFAAGDREALENSRTIEFEQLKVTTRELGVRTFRITKTPLFIKSPEPKLLIQAQDITERVKAEDEFARQRRLTESIIDAIPSQLAVLDYHGTIVAVNQAWDNFGYDNGAVDANLVGVGVNYLESCCKARNSRENGSLDAGRALAGIKDILSEVQTEFTMEYECSSPERIRHYQMNVSSLEYEGRRGALVFHFDITQRKKAENIIRASHRRVEEQVRERTAELQLFEKIFSSAMEGIVLTDAAGTILNVNEAFVRITGYGREEAIGQNTRLLKSGRHADSFFQEMWRQLIEEDYWEGEIWNRRSNGEVYPEWLSCD